MTSVTQPGHIPPQRRSSGEQPAAAAAVVFENEDKAPRWRARLAAELLALELELEGRLPQNHAKPVVRFHHDALDH